MGKHLAKNVETFHCGAERLLNVVRNKKLAKEDKTFECGTYLLETKELWKDVLWLCKAVGSVDYDIDPREFDALQDWIEGESGIMKCFLVEGDKLKFKPLWNGSKLVQTFGEYGLKQGRQVGEVLAALRDLRLRNPAVSQKDAHAFVVAWLNRNSS